MKSKKRNSIISVLVALAMVLPMCVTPVRALPPEEAILGDSPAVIGYSLGGPATFGSIPTKTIASFDFEDQTIGAVPTGWNQLEMLPADVHVVVDPQDSTNKVFKISSGARRTNKVGFLFGYQEDVYVKASFRMYVPSGIGDQQWARVQLASDERSAKEGNNLARVGTRRMDGVDKIIHTPGPGTANVEIPNTALNRWISYDMVVDVPSQTYSIYVDGEKEVTDAAFEMVQNTEKSTYVERLVLLSGGDTSLYYVDDVIVEVADIVYTDEVTGFAPSASVSTVAGTEFESLTLPATILTYTQNNSAGVEYPVRWDETTYNKNNITIQTIKGIVQLPEGVKGLNNNNVTITVDVAVPEYLPVEIVAGKYRYLFAAVDETGFVWTSENETVATVSQDGLVSALSAGSTKIVGTATGGEEYKYQITIVADTEEQRFKDLKANWVKAHGVDLAVDYTEPDYVAMVEEINVKAKDLWQTMDMSLSTNNEMWATGQNTNALVMKMHFDNYATMLKAFSYPGGELYQNKLLFKDTVDGIDIAMNTGIRNLKFGNQAAVGNWYEWQIATPFRLNDSMMMLSDYLPKETIELYCNASMKYPNIESWSGANVGETCFSVLAPAIIMNDTAQLTRIKNQMPRAGAIVTSGNGVYPDGSYMFHSGSPYNLGYGMAFMDGVMSVLPVLSGSEWAADSLNSVVVNYVRDGLVPIMHQGSGMGMFNGRGISREPKVSPPSPELASGLSVISNIVKTLPLASPEEQAYFKQAIKYWVTTAGDYYDWETVINVKYRNQVKDIINDPSISSARPVNGSKIYGYIDRVVQHANTYTAGLSMYSKRTFNFNNTGSENRKSWHTGDGMLYIYDNDLRQFGAGFLPTINIKRLPGITVDSRMLAQDQNKEKKSTEAWAGASTLGNATTAGMIYNAAHLTPADMNLYAKKSYFFVEDKIIAMGSDISSTSAYDIETIIENRMLRDDKSNIITINGQVDDGTSKERILPAGSWVHQEGNITGTDLGYYFLEDSNVHTQVVTGTGSFYPEHTAMQLSSPGDTVHTKNYFEIFVNHGSNIADQTYSYVILPGKTAEETRISAENSTVKVLEQSQDIHAIKDGNRIMMNIWNQNGGSIGGVTTNRASSITMERNGGTLTLAISQPEQKNQVVDVALDYEIISTISMDPGITTRQENGRTIISANTTDKAGHSLVIVLEIDTVDNTFEGNQVGDSPEQWVVANGTGKVVQETGTNKALEVTAENNKIAKVKTNLRSAVQGTKLSLRYKVDSSQSGQIALQGTFGTIGTLAIAEGNISIAGQTTPFSENQWHEIGYLIDARTRTFAVEVDNMLLASGIPYSGSVTALLLEVPSVAWVDDVVEKEMNTQIPTIPQRLSYTELSARYVNLTWDASVDDKEGVMYNLYQDNVKLTSTLETNYNVINLLPDTAYSFTVIAEDSDGNLSLASLPLGVRTINESSNVVIDFEGETIGMTPLGWIKSGTDETGKLEVMQDPLNVANKVLYINSDVSGKDVKATYKFDPITGVETITLKAHYQNKNRYVSFRLGDTNGDAVNIMTDLVSNVAVMTYHKKGVSANAGRVKLMDFNANQWYEFKIEVNVPNKTYNLWCNGTKLLTNEPFYGNSVAAIDTILVTTPNSGTGGIHVDDISLPSGIQIADTVVSIDQPADITVPYNTNFYSLGLPETVSIITTNSPTGTSMKVNWKRADYDKTVQGDQIITGKIVTPANIVCSNPNTQIKVVVGQPETYTVTIDSTIEHGTVLTDYASAIEGTDVVLRAIPESGYQFKKLIVNGNEVTVNASMEHQFVLSANTVVSAEFEEIPVVPTIYTVVVDSSANGSVTSSHTTAPHGTMVTLKVIPDSGYELEKLFINGVEATIDTNLEHQFMLTTDIHVTATFTEKSTTIPNTYTVTIDSALVNGTLAASHTIADEGTLVTIQAVPARGYELSKLFLNSNEVILENNSKYSFALYSDTIVSAEFRRIETLIPPEPQKPSTGSSSSEGSKKVETADGKETAEATPLTQKEILQEIGKAIDTILASTNEESKKNIDVVLKNSPVISGETIANILAKVSADQEIRILADSIEKGRVVGRMYLPLSSMPAGKEVTTTLATTSKATTKANMVFAKFFSNKVNVIELAHQGGFGTEIKVAIQTDFDSNSTKAEDIAIYSYDVKTNHYKELTEAKPYIDSNGYVHFTVAEGGVVIISNGKLTKK